MDKHHAQFLLAGFRPNGADADDPAFAAALHLAASHPELAEWLTNQRSFDAACASALSQNQVPDHLREPILALLQSLPHPDHPTTIEPGSPDDAWRLALATIQPPADLRARILRAVETSRVEANMPSSQSGSAVLSRLPRLLRAWGPALATAAAGVACAFWFIPSSVTPRTPATASLPVEQLQDEFIHTIAARQTALTPVQGGHEELIRELKQRNLPCPCCLPPGLRHGTCLGCREIVVRGKRGSLVGLRCSAGNTIHLVAFRREDVSDDLPGRDHPLFSQHGNLATARWRDDAAVFILIGQTQINQLASLF